MLFWKRVWSAREHFVWLYKLRMGGALCSSPVDALFRLSWFRLASGNWFSRIRSNDACGMNRIEFNFVIPINWPQCAFALWLFGELKCRGRWTERRLWLIDAVSMTNKLDSSHGCIWTTINGIYSARLHHETFEIGFELALLSANYVRHSMRAWQRCSRKWPFMCATSSEDNLEANQRTVLKNRAPEIVNIFAEHGHGVKIIDRNWSTNSQSHHKYIGFHSVICQCPTLCHVT